MTAAYHFETASGDTWVFRVPPSGDEVRVFYVRQGGNNSPKETYCISSYLLTEFVKTAPPAAVEDAMNRAWVLREHYPQVRRVTEDRMDMGAISVGIRITLTRDSGYCIPLTTEDARRFWAHLAGVRQQWVRTNGPAAAARLGLPSA
jgi:hypothetical protein